MGVRALKRLYPGLHVTVKETLPQTRRRVPIKSGTHIFKGTYHDNMTRRYLDLLSDPSFFYWLVEFCLVIRMPQVYIYFYVYDLWSVLHRVWIGGLKSSWLN